MFEKTTEAAGTTYSKDEWMAEGQRLFGGGMFQWRFVCPCCGNIQSVEQFRAYKSLGASPDSAYLNCIGRYAGAKRKAFGGEGPGPCDYASGGLFNVNKVHVLDGGTTVHVFDFDRSAALAKASPVTNE